MDCDTSNSERENPKFELLHHDIEYHTVLESRAADRGAILGRGTKGGERQFQCLHFEM
jgi:hypothetical protein